MKKYYAIIEKRVEIEAKSLRVAQKLAAGNLPQKAVTGYSVKDGPYRLKSLESKVICVTVDP